MRSDPVTNSSTTTHKIPSSARIAELYKTLIKLDIRFEKQDVSASHVEQTELFCERFLETLINYPAPLLAQLHYNKSNLNYFYNFQFNSLVFCGLLLLRNNFNLTTAQQILSGVLTWCITAKPEIEARAGQKSEDSECNFSKIKTQLIRALSHYQRQIWVELLTHTSAKAMSQLQRLVTCRNTVSPNNDYLSVTLYMASLVTRAPDKAAISYSKAMVKITQTCHCFALSLIEPLMDYPGTILPGSTLLLSDNQRALYLGRHQSELYCLTYSASLKNYDEEISAITESQIRKVAAPGILNNIKLADKWWGQAWQELQTINKVSDSQKIYARGFRLDKPPESLVAVIEHLSAQDIDIDQLIALIESEPSFADHLQLTASQQSRANLRINNVKHGLLMHGFERTQSVLVEKALTSRLSQHRFPMQDIIYQFVKLWSSFAHAIALRHPKFIPEQASCWVYFAAAGLFTHGELKLKQHWQYSNTDSTRDSHKIQLKQPQMLWQHAYKLACSWAQDKAIRDALRDGLAKQSLPPTAKRSLPHVLLNLSLNLASSLFFEGEAPEFDSDEYLQQYCQRLAIDRGSYRDICQETVKNSHNYWPIHNKCLFGNG
ncbi:hypothetical protein MACH26_31650 [Planctobacterium marinum]|uniref:Uncharacterized protein n=2 Tax=Planctobacterium marinum TaxID=1631968 RepID=A0AA48HLW3_9ALTE|nr:hypothetical protein MACH26_31650 [Planctobacterium marinum]